MPVVAEENTGAERSSQVVPSAEPCNLKVLVVAEEIFQVLKFKLTPEILIELAAVHLNKSTPTQFNEGLNAERVVSLLSIELAIILVEKIVKPVETAIGFSRLAKLLKQVGDST